jgi:hypothetical protein
MNYKIVNRHNNVIITTVSAKKEGEQFIAGIADTTPDLIVVPSHYQWLQSIRHNDYRWMELPFDNQ